MYFLSPYSKGKIAKILNEQIDPFPKLMRCLITLNASRFIGTSSVCGIINDNSFEIRNRKDPYRSLRAKGEFIEDRNGTIIKVIWLKPKLSFLTCFFRDYDYDKKIIIKFFKDWLNVKETDIS